jgi:hypothetical protein
MKADRLKHLLDVLFSPLLRTIKILTTAGSSSHRALTLPAAWESRMPGNPSSGSANGMS